MKRMRLALAVGLGTALLTLAALSGCAAESAGDGSQSASKANSGSLAHPSSASTGAKPPTGAATATPTAKPATPDALPANALFRITATVTASNGAIADLSQTVYEPIAQDAADIALLNQQCNYPGVPDLRGQPTWQAQVPGALFLTSDLTAKLRPGSPAFDNSKDFVYFGMPGAPGAYGGDYGIFEAYCDTGYIRVPGAIHGVAPISSTNPVFGISNLYGWAAENGSSYGFAGGGNSPDSPDTGGSAVVKDCVVQVSAAAAAAAPKVAAWTSQAYSFGLGYSYAP